MNGATMALLECINESEHYLVHTLDSVLIKHAVAEALDEIALLREFVAAVRRKVCDIEGEELAAGEPAESLQIGRLQVADEIRAALTRLDEGRKG